MGHRMRQLLATLCVTSSLALGGSNPSSGFHLQTLSFSRLPKPSRGPLGTQLLYPLLLQLARCTRSRGGG
jgi:hypothetical protein